MSILTYSSFVGSLDLTKVRSLLKKYVFLDLFLIFFAITTICVAILLLLTNCTRAPKSVTEVAPTPPNIIDTQSPSLSVSLKDLTSQSVILNKGRVVSLPAKGKFVQESHYQTSADKDLTISAHLARSCEILKATYKVKPDCSDVYSDHYKREWTPAEGGGAVGANARSTKVSIEREMWQGNMYFTRASLPPSGEKWLIWNEKNHKCVVLSMGDEIGPSSPTDLGGVTTEVQWYLGADNSTELNLAPLKNQDLKYGPIGCEL